MRSAVNACLSTKATLSQTLAAVIRSDDVQSERVSQRCGEPFRLEDNGLV